MSYNKLLNRQINKYLPDDLKNHPSLSEFFQAVNDSYQAFEKDKALAERAFSISESEYIEINERLNRELELKSKSVGKIRETIDILGQEEIPSTDDIGVLTSQLYRQVALASQNDEVINSLFNSYGTGIVFENIEGRIILVNQPFCDLLTPGHTTADLMSDQQASILSKVYNNFLEPDSVLANSTRMRQEQTLATGDTILLKDGRIIERNYIPVKSAEGFKGHLWALNDITEKKRLENALLEEKNFTEGILNNVPADIAVFDMNHRYLFVNPTGIRDEGLRKWIIGKDDFDYCKFKGIGTELAEKRRKTFNEVVSSKKAVEYLDEFPKKEGGTTYVYRRFYPVMIGDTVKYVIGYGVDVSSVVEAESKIKKQKAFYENILDMMPIDVGVLDKQFRFVYLNKKAVKRDEIREWMIGKTENDFVEKTGKGGELTARRISMMQKAIDTGQIQQWTETYREGAADELHVMRTISNYTGLDEEPYLLATGSDVTAIALAEKELKSKNEALQKTNSELDRFVYSTSHDLRAPLTSVLGLIRIIEMHVPSTETKQHDRIKMMKESVRKLDDFIAEILDYSRNARSEVSIESVNVDNLFQGVIENLHYMEGSKSCEFILEKDPDFQLKSDARRIKVIMSNLVSNAIKYQDPKKDKCVVRVRFKKMNNRIELRVEDNGIGISDQNQAKIFEMFYRATSIASGSGLGLYIVKETADKLGGIVSVESKLGNGSAFSIILPEIKS
ncbi:MAG: PAS domain-containing sensor histidine kinase [Bacteroidota bacterium]